MNMVVLVLWENLFFQFVYVLQKHDIIQTSFAGNFGKNYLNNYLLKNYLCILNA